MCCRPYPVQPCALLAGEPLSLVGESYNPQRSLWSDGASKAPPTP